MLKAKDGHLDLTDRLDELENQFALLAGRPLTKDMDKVAKASALALMSLAIDSLHEVIADAVRQEENEASALKINSSN
jgi:hypothetical protein